MVGAAEKYTDAIPWLIVAGGVLAAWLVLFTIVARATMPRLPEPGPETMDVGPESPAIANLLVNRCRVTTSAISATLVDLAARGHLAIDRIGEGDELVRVRRAGRDETNAYETQTLDLVRTAPGTTPCPPASCRSATARPPTGGGIGSTARLSTTTASSASCDADSPRGSWCCSPQHFSRRSSRSRSRSSSTAKPPRAAGDDFDAGSGFVFAGILWAATLLTRQACPARLARDARGRGRRRALAWAP